MATRHDAEALYEAHDALSAALAISLKDLTPRELRRVEPTLRIIQRDRRIRAAFRDLRDEGVERDEVIFRLSQREWDGQYLSEHQIWRIVYKG